MYTHLLSSLVTPLSSEQGSLCKQILYNIKIIVLKFVCLSRFEWLSATDERHVCEFSGTCISMRHNKVFWIGRFVEFLFFLISISTKNNMTNSTTSNSTQQLTIYTIQNHILLSKRLECVSEISYLSFLFFFFLWIYMWRIYMWRQQYIITCILIPNSV